MRCRPGLRSGAGPAELQQEICCETECLQLTAANVSSGSKPVGYSVTAMSAFVSCRHSAVQALVGNGPRLCENSARYNRTRNFEACGHAQSKETQKFILRSLSQRQSSTQPVPLNPWPG
jgi:hypothetical protein